MDVEPFPVDRYVMVVPAQSDQLVGVGPASVGPGSDVVDLEPVAAGATFHGAPSVPGEDVMFQPAIDDSGLSS